MKIINGIYELLNQTTNLDEPWCFFVKKNFINNKNDIENSVYYIAESEDEFDEMDDTPDKYKPWLEYQTFKAIIENKLEHQPDASSESLLDAIIYYLEEDEFLD